MKKIVLLPLDERPCNYQFPYKLFSHKDLQIVRPKKLGEKKKPADIDSLCNFLEKECIDADGLVIALDMLLYGGLIPSRLHNRRAEELIKRMAWLRKLKQENPKLVIYGFQCVMRCPSYSSDDEEPDYYEQYGELIHKLGEAIHKSRLGLIHVSEVKRLLEDMDQEKLNDYLVRRECNKTLNLEALHLVEDGVIDELVIPQDDSAPYGYAAMDQIEIRNVLLHKNLMDKVLMYPGADEVALTLIARMVNTIHGTKPRVYVKYASEQSKSVIPIYEGNSLENTIKYHILSAGCRITEQDDKADFILGITAPAFKIEESDQQPCMAEGYMTERNIPEFLDYIKDCMKDGKRITICDNAYGNGGELLLIQLLNKNNLLDQVSGYAGWNTSANTLGTAIAEGVDALHYGKSASHMNFLMERYVEDAGYCSLVRGRVSQRLEKYGMNYFDVKDVHGIISKEVAEELNDYIKKYLSSQVGKITLDQVWMPWHRMFEVGIEVNWHA